MRAAARRVQLLRRTLKPPSTPASERLCPRRFSFRHPRLLLATHHSYPRPQLPFLYPSGQYLANGRVLRLFSINATQRKFIKETAKLSVKYSIIIFCMTTCFSIASFGILSERQERAFPSPHEWSWITRVRFRRGKWWQVDENNEKEGFVNWARVYNELEPVLQRLEDPNKDGQGLVKLEDGAILVPGVGEAGLDITAKSEEWRQGYFEVLMGMAKGAEQMEGWVTRKGKRYIWSPEFVESPDNPRPRAVLPGRPEVPDVEERIPATEPPEKFYLKILTTTGFTSRQRMSAALGYADWLNFKKLPESAEETYRWALDIAISGLSTSNPSTIINRETGILSVNAPKELITPNIVYTATNLATFFAEHDRVTEALPIFISVLRARISADPAPPYVKPTQDSSITGTLLSLLSEPDYPPVPPSGDETLLRDEKDRCEEAVLRNYIGEILFVTAGSSDNQRKQGLKWVRDGVSTAKIAQTLDPIRNDDDLRKKCEKCEEVGLESWGKIMSYLAHEAREERDAAKSSTVTNLVWKLWGGTAKLDEAVENLEDEEGGVVMRLDKLRRKMRKDEFAEMDRKYARTFVF